MSNPEASYLYSWSLDDEQATTDFGAVLSMFLRVGDWIGIEGNLGAGKTTLARALIRTLHVEDIDVPSPTFTLIQLYEDGRLPVAHLDLYRLKDVSELDELGLDDLLDDHVVVVEWSDRLAEVVPQHRLKIELQGVGDGRSVTASGFGTWSERLSRMVGIEHFIQRNAPECSRHFLQGDASARRYERLTCNNGERLLLMDMPARSEPSTPGGGTNYADLVHLADDIGPVLAINGELRARGFAAPATRAADIERGIALIEDFGDQVFGTLTGYGQASSEPMRSAVKVLATIAAQNWPAIASADGATATIESYSCDVLMTEAELLLEWFWTMALSEPADEHARESYRGAWQTAFNLLAEDPRVWVLRDFHSPNLIWIPKNDGIMRVGLIDTQDAVLGSPAYDLVALLQDARLDVADNVEHEMLAEYIELRQEDDAEFDETGFRRSYAILGAQRAAKILGIFARLSQRDGKHGYLQHLPRVSRALDKNLQHPALAHLKSWFDANLSPDIWLLSEGN